MTRVVVLGPYPPSADPQGDVVLDLVRRLRADGATVTVVSPEPSAAPEHGDPTRWAGATRVARAVRGVDRVIWFARAGSSPAPPLRRALRSVPRVEIRAWAAPADARRRALATRVRLVRAGAPTFVRSWSWRRRDR